MDAALELMTEIISLMSKGNQIESLDIVVFISN
jgi:hypothetical protein